MAIFNSYVKLPEGNHFSFSRCVSLLCSWPPWQLWPQKIVFPRAGCLLELPHDFPFISLCFPYFSLLFPYVSPSPLLFPYFSLLFPYYFPMFPYFFPYIYILYNIHTFICSIGTNSPISFTSLLWRQDRQFQVPLKSLPLGSWWPHRWQAKACHWGMEGQNMKHTMGRTCRFPESWGYPQIIQVMDDHSSIDTHGFGMFWGSPILRNPPHGYVMVDLLAPKNWSQFWSVPV